MTQHKSILVRFPDADHLAIALGFKSKEEMFKDYDTVEKAVEGVWSDIVGEYTARVVDPKKVH